jgi:hypothetical protein
MATTSPANDQTKCQQKANNIRTPKRITEKTGSRVKKQTSMTCTIFKNIFSKEPNYISVDAALNRIVVGKSKALVEQVRSTLDKEKAQKIKSNLPSVCFSGLFGPDRTDGQLEQHSGFMVLDFDSVDNLRERQTDIISCDFVYACWISPSGNGLKALVRIADGTKHREHFQALQEVFSDIDGSGSNPSRVCYESYDPEMYINRNAGVFKKTKKTEKIVVQERNAGEQETFLNLLKWMSNRKDAFVTGERNNFLFKLASACCRFGIDEQSANSFITGEFLVNSEFSKSEADRAIKSGYRANRSRQGTAVFEKELLVDKVTRQEVVVDVTLYDESIRPKDVIYGIDVKENALKIYDEGYERLMGIGVNDIDFHFKPKRGELTLLTGYGNAGKSTFKKWYQCLRAIRYGERFATFSPEDNPPEEYYHDFVEILLGCDCTPENPHRPSREVYERAYDWISQYVFYMYPKDVQPTPDYIKERFLELIIKEKVDGVDIDPFNRMSNNYAGFAGRDKYLEFHLSDFARFAQANHVYFWIIAHPVKTQKDTTGNYPCPDVFDVADGAMWNNMTDNILVYHRPFAQSEPKDPMCEFHSKKIRRQKSVGRKGTAVFEMKYETRHFYFNGSDPLQKALNEKNIDFRDTGMSTVQSSDLFTNDYLQSLGEEELPF